MLNETHTVNTSLSLTDLIRLVRAMPPEMQAAIAGFTGGKILLRCKDEFQFELWCKEWQEFTKAT